MSVIVASFNHAPYVAQAVLSVLEQSVRDVEVLVVDDGSTDGTPDIVDALGDPRVTLVRLKENRAQQVRNIGLGLAKGRFVAFQNSDDVWRQGKLAAQLEILESRPELAACFTNVETIGVDGLALAVSDASPGLPTHDRSQAEWLRRFFDYGNCLYLSSSLVRRDSLVALGGFRGSLIQLSDLDLWVRLVSSGGFFVTAQALTAIRILESNLSRPTAAHLRRTAIEYGEVLMRFSAPPLLDFVPMAFADVLPPDCRGAPAVLAQLVRYAWGRSAAHHMFADRVMAAVLDDPDRRQAMVAVCGPQIVHEFLMRRSRLEVHIVPEHWRSGVDSGMQKGAWRHLTAAGLRIGSRVSNRLRTFRSNRSR